jgi:hypothetical protein
MHGGSAKPNLLAALADYGDRARSRRLSMPSVKRTPAVKFAQPPLREMRLHTSFWPDTDIPLLYACVTPATSPKAVRAAVTQLHRIFRGFAFSADGAVEVPWCNDAAVYRTEREISLWAGGKSCGRCLLPNHPIWHTAGTCVVAVGFSDCGDGASEELGTAVFCAIEAGRAVVCEAGMSTSRNGVREMAELSTVDSSPTHAQAGANSSQATAGSAALSRLE